MRFIPKSNPTPPRPTNPNHLFVGGGLLGGGGDQGRRHGAAQDLLPHSVRDWRPGGGGGWRRALVARHQGHHGPSPACLLPLVGFCFAFLCCCCGLLGCCGLLLCVVVVLLLCCCYVLLLCVVVVVVVIVVDIVVVVVIVGLPDD